MRRGVKDGGCIQGPQPGRPLAIVKFAAKAHIASSIHAWCCTHADEVRRLKSEEVTVATTIGLQVLSLTKEADSDKSFERRITTLAASGVNVGTKNHSFHLVPKLRTSMHKVLIASFQKLLTDTDPATGREPVFATIIDKATVDRETGQMMGIIVMIKGELVPIFLSTLLAPDASGNGLMLLLIECLMNGQPLKLSLELLRRSYTAFAADGQYQSAVEGHDAGLAVQQHLCQELNLNARFLLSRWDGAHRLELGQDTVRSKIEFYRDLAVIVVSVQEKHLYGKGFDRVKKDAKALGSKLAAIGTICTTRFCHSERKVYKNFFRNLIFFVRDLVDSSGGQHQEPRKRSSEGSSTRSHASPSSYT